MLYRVCQYFKPLSISLSPNIQTDDIWLAFCMLLQPWRWQKGKEVQEFEQEFARYMGTSEAVAFNSGRSALMAILDALALEKGSEVLLQAFTCNAVPNPVQWLGLKPVYVDCKEEDYNMNAEDLERKITPRSKAVIVQHTFGIPADIDAIQEVCRKYNLILLEDCAHALGARYKGKLVGTFGKAALFSLSRDKVLSCVYGGIALAQDPMLAARIRAFQKSIGYPSHRWILQQLLHPLFMNLLILPTYRMLGKYLLILFQAFGVLSKAVHWKEKRGRKPPYFPKALPASLSVLASHQLQKLERMNQHRKEVAAFYRKKLEGSAFKIPAIVPEKEAIYLRFPLQHEHAHAMIRKFWKQNILVGDWYTSPVSPDDTQLESVGYKKGSCPAAERLSNITFNLPTHINTSFRDAERILSVLNEIKLCLWKSEK